MSVPVGVSHGQLISRPDYKTFDHAYKLLTRALTLIYQKAWAAVTVVASTPISLMPTHRFRSTGILEPRQALPKCCCNRTGAKSISYLHCQRSGPMAL